MSLSVNRHSSGSITYCDEFESDDDDLIHETATAADSSQPKRRQTSFVPSENHFETSTPRFCHSKPFGKENDSRSVRNEKQRRGTALETIHTGNQSLIRNMVKSATTENKMGRRKNSNRTTMSFEIYRPGDEDSSERSFHNCGEFKTPTTGQKKLQVLPGLPSPEYEPGTFFDQVILENESLYHMKAGNSVCSSKEQAQRLMEMYPDADTEFLRSQSEPMTDPLGDVVDSTASQVENNRIPTNAKNQEAETNSKHYSVDQILKLVPDPWTYFSDKGRDCTEYSDHSLHYLKTKFRKFYNQTITDALLFHNQNLYLAYKYLKKKNRGLKLRMTNRPMSECNSCKPNTANMQFLLEVAFIEREEEVKNYVKAQKAAKKFRLKEGARLGLLVECECCYGERLLREDVVICDAGHTFCKECIARYIETGIRNGMSQLQCLGPCNKEYPLQVLWDLLTPEIFSKLIETLEFPDVPALTRCPFCRYSMILPPGVAVIACLNVQCLRESCRFCKGPNHEPMKCDVITTALSDRCWQCGKEVKKEDGCNEMVCSCGERTCHFCKQAVKNNSHFFLYEDEDGSKCPLYSTDYFP